MIRRTLLSLIFTVLLPICHNAEWGSIYAQVGEYRNRIAIGAGIGYNLSSVGFSPKVNQKMLGGKTLGISMRYTSEKYFSTICSIYSEINYSQLGWSENIVDMQSELVKNPYTEEVEVYDRRIDYIQIPVMAHLAWGQEFKGFNFFFQAGPQFGYMLSETTHSNFTCEKVEEDGKIFIDGTLNLTDRANKITEQYFTSVSNRLDYGIAAGVGLEYSHSNWGHILLSTRYYLGLGNIFPSSKSDYFSRSNNSSINIRLSYLVDL